MAPTTQYTPQLHGIASDPLAGVKFTLNAFGVAGFFGGDTAVNGMATVIFFLRRRWGGLYNTPGSLEIAKRYGQLASPRLFRGLFPGDTRDPSQLFGLDDKPGPKFLAACSGSLFEKTSHLGHLIARMAKQQPFDSVFMLAQTEPQRITTPATVTVVDLTHLGSSKPLKVIHPTLPYTHYGFVALVPIAASIAACVGCILVGDWWSFSSIVMGMIANGWACFVLGLGRLTFQHPEPARDAPPGDGILWAADNAVVVIRGAEHAVNAITRGHFFLQYHHAPQSRERNSWVRIHVPPLFLLSLGRRYLDYIRHHARQLTNMNLGRVTQQMPIELGPLRRRRTVPIPGDGAGGDALPTRMTEMGAPPLTAGDGEVFSPTLNSPMPEASPPPTTPAPTVTQEALPSAVTQGLPTPSAIHSEPRTPTPNVPVPKGMPSAQPVPPVHVANAEDNAPESRKPDSLFISISSILLTIQFVAQLFLIPQASVFGQFMFVGTLAFSWGYNVFISSIDSEEVQTGLLCDLLGLTEVQDAGHNTGGDPRRRRFGVQKFEFGTWTAMAVFACLALRPTPIPKPSSTQKFAPNPASAHSCAPESSSTPALSPALPPNPAPESTPMPNPAPKSSPALESNPAPSTNPSPGASAALQSRGTNSPPCDSPDLAKVLDALIPNDTKIWNDWKEMLREKLPSGDLDELQDPASDAPLMLKLIIDDAKVAYGRYSRYYGL